MLVNSNELSSSEAMTDFLAYCPASEQRAQTNIPGISLMQACPLFLGKGQWKPQSICRQLTYTLLQTVHKQIIPFLAESLSKGYRVYVVDQVRGQSYYDHKVITVPKWIFSEPQVYWDWYLAHEVAHSMFTRWNSDGHGAKFMEMLIKICPAQSLHYETNYKPKNAKMAGISQNTALNRLNFTGELPADF